MSITNLSKQHLLQWKDWNTQWVNNTLKQWRELGENAITNSSKVDFSELWSTITTDWGEETRSWLDCISLIDNTKKPNISLWDDEVATWDGGTGWSNTELITNISKPA